MSKVNSIFNGLYKLTAAASLLSLTQQKLKEQCRNCLPGKGVSFYSILICKLFRIITTVFLLGKELVIQGINFFHSNQHSPIYVGEVQYLFANFYICYSRK